MKAFTLLIAIAIPIIQVQAKDKIIVESTIDSVTVYQKGAEVIRLAEVELEGSFNSLVFTNLTEELSPRSIQFKGDGDYTITAIKHEVKQKPFSEIPPIVKDLRNRLSEIMDELDMIVKLSAIFEAEREILTKHRNMSHSKMGITVEKIERGASLFRNRLTEILELEIANDLQIEALKSERDSLKNVVHNLIYEEEEFFSEVTVELDVPKAQKINFTLNYYVKNAKWTPSYDIKMKTVEHPLDFTFKANISQNTGEDWKDVSLCVATGEPDNNQTPKKMRVEIVDFEDAVKAVVIEDDASIFTLAGGPGEICGKIKDMEMDGEGLPFANVYVEVNGIPRGTSTDMDGFYSIKPLPVGRYDVTVEYIGYGTQKITEVLVTNDRAAFVDVEMREDAEMLQEVLCVAYEVPLIDENRGSGLTVTGKEITNMPTRDVNSIVAMAASGLGTGADVGGGGIPSRDASTVVATAASVYQVDESESLSVRGSKDDGTDYFIDGVKVRGNATVPASSIDEMTVLTGGVPARYGDSDGGINRNTDFDVSGYNYSNNSNRGTGVPTSYGYSVGSNNIVNTAIPKKIKKRSITNTTYLIEERYSIDNGDNDAVIIVDKIDIVADYTHYIVPAHERTAFLTANIPNWEDYSFLDGPLNLFVEGKFTGKSFLEAQVVTDTLTISLGNDPNVIVERNQIKDYQSSNVFGNKKTDQFGYRINVRNNKQQAINLVIQDQIPISRVSSIVVKTEEMDATQYNKEKGFLDWEYSLPSGSGKSHEFKYSIKYPSKKQVVIR